MGLDIKRYSFSYRTLHLIRGWVLKEVEKSKIEYMCYTKPKCNKCLCCLIENSNDLNKVKQLTKFPELLCHSDCDGGYRYNRTSTGEHNGSSIMWGDLKKLKQEIKELAKYKDNLPEDLKNAYEDLEYDINNSRDVLIFM